MPEPKGPSVRRMSNRSRADDRMHQGGKERMAVVRIAFNGSRAVVPVAGGDGAPLQGQRRGRRSRVCRPSQRFFFVRIPAVAVMMMVVGGEAAAATATSRMRGASTPAPGCRMRAGPPGRERPAGAAVAAAPRHAFRIGACGHVEDARDRDPFVDRLRTGRPSPGRPEAGG